MSLELINTLGTVTTVVIVAAAAIAALVQLRHLRAGNQINAMLTIGESLDKEFLDASRLVRRDLPAALEDPEFRAYSVAVSRGLPPPETRPEYAELRRKAAAVANKFEELGILVNHGIVDRDLFSERYASIISNAWNALETFIAFSREVTGTKSLWENFEFLTVLGREWMGQHPEGIYPKGARRLQLHNPWPVPPLPVSA